MNAASRREPTTLPLQTRFAPVTSVDAEARTATVVWTTGAPVRRRRWTGWDSFVDYEERLVVTPDAVNMERLNSGAPVLESHDQWTTAAVMAVVERAWIDDGSGWAEIRFPPAGVDDAADRLLAKVDAGVVRNLSVGYSIDRVRIEKSNTPGEIEVWHVERWTPHEISFVAIGADPRAQVRDARQSFPVIIKEHDMDESQAAETAHETGPATTVPAEVQERAALPDIEQARREVAERNAAIVDLIGRHNLPLRVASDLIAQGATLDAARAVVLERLAERDNRASGITVVSDPDPSITRRDAASEAILHRLAPEANALSERAREYRGMSLVDIARECLHAGGARTRGMTAGEIVQTAIRSGGTHGTSDFPLILGAVANKRLRQAYATVQRTFEPWTRGVTTTDFKPMYPTQIGNFPALLPVLEGAEFSYGTIAESRETYRLGTYGRIVGLTRQAIVNDDLRAFDRALSTAGAKAAELESNLVYGELLSNPTLADGVTLFSTAATRNNQGAAAAINEASVTEAIEKMAQQREIAPAGQTGERLANNRPRFILVPPGARAVEARKLVAAVTPAQTSQVNPYQAAFVVIEEARLFNTSGAQRWWLAADPALIDTIEYARLEGQAEPFLDQRVGFEVDGVEFKVRHDFAAKAIDFRGLFFNPGA